MLGIMEHRLYIEEVIHDFSNEQLTEDDNRDDCPEAFAHGKTEDALTCCKRACVEHVEEMCPNEYGEQQCLFIHRNLASCAIFHIEEIGNGMDICMLENEKEGEEQ